VLVILEHSDRKMYESASQTNSVSIGGENNKTHMSQTIHSVCHMIHWYNLKKYAQDNSHMYTPF
jgi:hypothetical protein